MSDIYTACKNALRISADDFDTEIALLVNAAKILMIAHGVKEERAIDDTDDAVRLAIVSYVKANFGLDNPEYDKYMNAFKYIVGALKLSTDYGKILRLEDENCDCQNVAN